MQVNQPVAYVSKSLTPTEIGYDQIEKEMLAIVFLCGTMWYTQHLKMALMLVYLYNLLKLILGTMYFLILSNIINIYRKYITLEAILAKI